MKQRMTIAERIINIREAAGSAQVLAVTKGYSTIAVTAAIAAGQRDFAENRVQEAMVKFPPLRTTYPDLRLHLIGPLQSNKVRDAVAVFDVIHSLDRPALASKLAQEMAKQNRRLPCFIQVNLGAEPQKSGVTSAELPALLKFCRQETDLNVMGLMCIPPLRDPPEEYFQQLKKLADTYGLENLSMGMSGDYQTAIACGATHVRIGSAIFGERDYSGGDSAL
jgi:pyridoxal phosphate enzyme (YggS family)